MGNSVHLFNVEVLESARHEKKELARRNSEDNDRPKKE